MDYEFYQDYGGNSESKINSDINNVNGFNYEPEVNVTHTITTLIIRSDTNDPYSTNNAGGLSTKFEATGLASNKVFKGIWSRCSPGGILMAAPSEWPTLTRFAARILGMDSAKQDSVRLAKPT